MGLSKCGCAHRCRMEAMAQFQTDVPHPLGENLPALLSRGSMRDPAIKVLLFVFIAEHGLEGSAMEIQTDNIGRGESTLRQSCEEEFIDHPSTRDPNWTLLFASWMGRDHYTTQDAIRPHRHSRAVVERAHHATLWVGQMLIGRQIQTRLDLGSLQEVILFAAHHKRQSGQIGENRSRPILSIQAKQNTLFGVVMGLSVALNDRDSPTQFCPILSVPRVSKRGKPLMCMGL